MQYTDAASLSLAANYVYSINNFFIFRCAYAMFYLNNRGLEYLAHARTDCARHARAEVRGCVVLLIDGLSRFTYSRSPTRSLRVGNGLATLLDNMQESIHTHLWCLKVTQSKRISVPESVHLEVKLC